MKPAVIALASLVSLTACGKYNKDIHAQGPEPIPEEKEADWRLYGELPDFTTKVDWNSIGHEDASGNADYVYVWVMREFKHDQKPKTETEDDFRTEYSRFAIDCATSKIAGIAIERHDKKDEETSRKDVPGYQWTFEAPTPGSYQQDFMTQVCKIAQEKDQADQSDRKTHSKKK